jgi:hypothetical protein
MNSPKYALRLIVCTATLAALALAREARAQSFLLNGGFEAPSLGPGDSFALGTPTGWSGGFALVAGDAGNPVAFPPPPEGHQYAYFSQEPGFELWQTFTIPAAGLYQLDWLEGSASYISPELGEPAPYTVTLSSTTSGLLANGNFEAGNAGSWQAQSLQFELLPGEYTLTFDLSRNFGYLDNVTLTAVPEPQAYAFVSGMALLGFALFARRRQ